MKIEFSRHSKRRMKLYDITEEKVKDIINDEDIHKEGIYEVIKKADNFTYPIKIVYAYEKEKIVIITAYPLKRGKNENIL
jgi:undecaprenyl pyrophosphate synthase